MDRQGTGGPPTLPSQLFSSGAQRSTLPAYCAALGDFLEKVPFQTYASAPLNVPPERLSVDRTSNNQPQPPGGMEPDGRGNISDSGATTEPLAHDELENLPYWYEAQQVEKSLKICHVGDKIWRNNKYVHHVFYVVDTYLPDNWLPENARLRLRKQEKKQKRRKKEMQRMECLSTLRPRPSTRK
ncbi:uncharacterized protein PADG_08210 [Paracoccidioides brasiliensis Pb18]|uniref:Uncharacterized protein n=1 Tax=Paracoccidioides brasiliensis (strain Pb18) TaxID=502780 RepID=C1GMC4_PARBD|nr:uncharacterized protein PADG_08210 [Paracoccidioides brasiliensis Pb18]EEH43590.1 hypothetical protein PADG_08210 [Paracoccidioides brasiliensis Pb18]